MPHDGAHTTPGRLKPERAAAITRRTALLSVGVTTGLIALKAWAWIASGSVAMLASLADSALDAAASVFTLWAVTYAAKPADADHRHGHGKAEGFAALVQAMLVAASAALVGKEAVTRFLDPEPVGATTLGLIVMSVSIAATLALITAQTRAVRETGSVATAGDRAHYAADLGANLAVIAGLVLSGLLGISIADPLVGLGVALWLAWGAFGVAKSAIDLLMDRELDDGSRARIVELARADPAVRAVHMLRTRASGPYVHIQFHMDLDPALPLREAHAIMVAAEARILDAFPAADVLIHPDPQGEAEPHGQPSLAGVEGNPA